MTAFPGHAMNRLGSRWTFPRWRSVACTTEMVYR